MLEPVLERLFALHAPLLKAHLLRKCGDVQLCADLTQECFARLAHCYVVEPIDNVPGWLYRTANNLLVDHYRRERCHKTDAVGDEVLHQIVEPQPGPEEHCIRACRLQRMTVAVAELPSRTQEVLRLTRLEGLTHAEVAARLDICPSSVQKHLTTALVYLRWRLREDA